MVLSASCFSPQLSFADFDNACINLEQFIYVYKQDDVCFVIFAYHKDVEG